MAFDPTLNLADLDGSNGFTINGSSGGRSGYSVSSAGDINNDGIDDLIVGAPFTNSGAGVSYVVFGGGNVGSGGSLNVSAVDGSNGFVINGSSGSQLGYSVSSAGDINNDGIDDLIVGARSGNSGAGASYVVFGGGNVGSGGSLNVSALDGNNGFAINGSSFGLLGFSVSSAGDINNDGINDLIVGAPSVNSSAGASYVVFGGGNVGSGGSLNVSALDGSNGFAINGSSGSRSGSSVSSAGDINGDGIDDLIVGAPSVNSSAGASYVVFGGGNVGSGGSLNVSALDGSNGFAINGSSSFGQLGFSVSSAGDINNDGIDDLIVGAPSVNGGAGASYVVFGGGNVGSSGSLNLSALDGSNGFAINVISDFGQLGFSVSSTGDINNDGIDDLIVGATGANASYVVFGGGNVGSGGSLNLSALDGNNGFAINGSSDFGQLGHSVSSAGDINNDGIDDLIVGAIGVNSNAGASYVVFGGSTPANDAPTAVDFSNTTTELAEDADTTDRIKVADIDITDDGQGTNDLALSGDDADAFEIDGTTLYLKAGTTLDYETKPSYSVTVAVDDTRVGSTPDLTKEFTLDITNVSESPTANDDNATVGEEETITIDVLANDTDPDGDTLTIDSITAASNGTATIVNNTIRYTAEEGATSDEFTYTVSDGNGGTATATVNIAINSSVIIGTNRDDTLNGNSRNNVILGMAGNDQLNGLAGDDRLDGSTGNDILDGGVGEDDLIGGAGNDTYIIDNIGDDVSEGANRGTDTIRASISYTLNANVENLVLDGTATKGIGNSLSNSITGNSANNFLDGRAGADQMIGGAGNDTYGVNESNDSVVEAPGAGTDTVRSSISYTLSDNLENLSLLNLSLGSTPINGTGNSGNNVIRGNASQNQLAGIGGNDQLFGGEGNDSLIGGSGNDRLTGEAGADQFTFTSDSAFTTASFGVDTIADFNNQQDQIVLSKTSFTALGSTVSFATVTTNAAAASSTALIVYNSSNGSLFYNQNSSAAGLGSGGRFASLSGVPQLSASNFVLQS